jgi:hypothetical protein
MYIMFYIFQPDSGRGTQTSSHGGAFQPAHNGDIVLLKQWLECQFKELHRKIDAVAETQSHLKSLIFKKKNRKVRIYIAVFSGEHHLQ